jgi:hypothetical protein
MRTSAHVQRRVIAADPTLELYSRRYLIRGEQLIAEAIAGDLGCSPDDLVARMASAATLAVFHVLNAHEDAPEAALGPDRVRGEHTHADATAVLDQALLFVSAGIRALQIARAEDERAGR